MVIFIIENIQIHHCNDLLALKLLYRRTETYMTDIYWFRSVPDDSIRIFNLLQGHSSVHHMFCSLQMLVLSVHVFHKLESTDQMWFLTRTITNAKDNMSYIPVHELSGSLSSTGCQILPVAHA
jgi:hypothetical protein